MNDLAVWLACAAAGIALGVVYFYGLWLTVRRASRARAAALWFMLSWAARLTVLLGGLYWVGANDWRRYAAALAGIVLARMLLTRQLRELRSTHAAPLTGGGA